MSNYNKEDYQRCQIIIKIIKDVKFAIKYKIEK